MATTVEAAVTGLPGITYRSSRPVVPQAGDVWVDGTDVVVVTSVREVRGASVSATAAVAAIRAVPGYGGASVSADDLKVGNRRVVAQILSAPTVLDGGDL